MEVIKSIEYDSDQAKILFNNIDANNLKVINITGDSMQGKERLRMETLFI